MLYSRWYRRHLFTTVGPACIPWHTPAAQSLEPSDRKGNHPAQFIDVPAYYWGSQNPSGSFPRAPLRSGLEKGPPPTSRCSRSSTFCGQSLQVRVRRDKNGSCLAIWSEIWRRRTRKFGEAHRYGSCGNRHKNMKNSLNTLMNIRIQPPQSAETTVR